MRSPPEDRRLKPPPRPHLHRSLAAAPAQERGGYAYATGGQAAQAAPAPAPAQEFGGGAFATGGRAAEPRL